MRALGLVIVANMALAQSSCSLQPCMYSCVTSIANGNSCSKDDHSCQCTAVFENPNSAAVCMIDCPSADPNGIATSVASFCGCVGAIGSSSSDTLTSIPSNHITFPPQSESTRTIQTTWTNLGPLTTIFTPPPECQRLRGTQLSEPIWGGGCTASPSARPGVAKEAPLAMTLASSCYPSMYHRFATTTEASAFYSPGLVCPSGWGPVHYLPQTETGYQSAIDSVAWSALEPGETMIACCPDGYVEDLSMLCISPFSPTSTVVMISLHDSCVADLTTFTVTATAAGTATAGAIHLILPANETFHQSLPWLGHGRELSVVQKIAVGVAVPLGALLIVLVALLWRKRHVRKQQRSGQVLQVVHQQYMKPELDATAETARAQPVSASINPSELYGARDAWELHGARVPQELATQHNAVELDSGPVAIPSQQGFYSGR